MGMTDGTQRPTMAYEEEQKVAQTGQTHLCITEDM